MNTRNTFQTESSPSYSILRICVLLALAFCAAVPICAVLTLWFPRYARSLMDNISFHIQQVGRGKKSADYSQRRRKNKLRSNLIGLRDMQPSDHSSSTSTNRWIYAFHPVPPRRASLDTIHSESSLDTPELQNASAENGS